MLQARFGDLKQILIGNGLAMRSNAKAVWFDNAEGRTLLLFPPYRDADAVDPADLVAARHHLEFRGLPRERFEELLREKLVAG